MILININRLFYWHKSIFWDEIRYAHLLEYVKYQLAETRGTGLIFKDGNYFDNVRLEFSERFCEISAFNPRNLRLFFVESHFNKNLTEHPFLDIRIWEKSFTTPCICWFLI